jgi:hypothetical protein
MKKIDRLHTKARLVLRHEVVLNLTREQLTQVGGASGKTMCEGCKVDGSGGSFGSFG